MTADPQQEALRQHIAGAMDLAARRGASWLELADIALAAHQQAEICACGDTRATARDECPVFDGMHRFAAHQQKPVRRYEVRTPNLMTGWCFHCGQGRDQHDDETLACPPEPGPAQTGAKPHKQEPEFTGSGHIPPDDFMLTEEQARRVREIEAGNPGPLTPEEWGRVGVPHLADCSRMALPSATCTCGSYAIWAKLRALASAPVRGDGR